MTKGTTFIEGSYYLITGEHPHSGTIAKYLGVEQPKGLSCDGHLFESRDNGEKFFVFDPLNVALPALKLK